MQTIIFDFDGVIHDTFEIAYSINLDVLGSDLTRETYRDFFNGNIYSHSSVTKETAAAFNTKCEESFAKLRLDPNTKLLLEQLKQKYELFIITSNQECVIKPYFERSDASHIFTEILGVETHKSKVKKFEYIFEKYNTVGSDCIFVTDTLGDILEGNKAGVTTIAVNFGFHDATRLAPGNPYRIVSSLEELMSTITELQQ